MGSRFHRALFLAALLAQTTPARANDFTVGGSGADLVPVDEARVRMEGERITMTLKDDTFDVVADYVFSNPSSEAVSVQVGFPEILCPGDVDCNARFWDLETVVAGTPVQHRKGKLQRKHAWSQHLGTVWLFDVTFAPGARTEIRHTYRTTAGGSVDQYGSFAYVTRTGATWAGSIGHAVFSLKLPPEAHVVSNTMGKPALVQPKDGEPYVELRLEHRDWEPQNDLHVNFQLGPLMPPELGEDRLARSGVKAEHECDDVTAPKSLEAVRTCKNLVYALSGFPFTRPELRKYFYGGPQGFRLAPFPHAEPGSKPPLVWVRGLQELPSHDRAKMPAANQAWLKRLDQLAGRMVDAGAPEPSSATLDEPGVEAPASTEKPALAPRSVDPPRAPPVAPAPRSSSCSCSFVGLDRSSSLWQAWTIVALLAAARRRRLRRVGEFSATRAIPRAWLPSLRARRARPGS